MSFNPNPKTQAQVVIIFRKLKQSTNSPLKFTGFLNNPTNSPKHLGLV